MHHFLNKMAEACMVTLLPFSPQFCSPFLFFSPSPSDWLCVCVVWRYLWMCVYVYDGGGYCMVTTKHAFKCMYPKSAWRYGCSLMSVIKHHMSTSTRNTLC